MDDIRFDECMGGGGMWDTAFGGSGGVIGGG